ncbi:sulfatase [Histidinibacterium lentulum]|uniref:Sulfatase n=1 Tax=Histidinibacterium lentulum TaxID=2480588 RepID=A0A3N2QSE6_9RHOB|nr:sulfatase [Histidinibacterium lentulum]
MLRCLLSAAILYLVLIQPNHPAAMTWGALTLFPLELPVILLALMALPARARVTVYGRGMLVAILMIIAVLKLADYATFLAYGRGFNPVVDLHLLPAAWRLGSGIVGMTVAILVAGAAVALVLAVTWALWWATGVWASVEPWGGRTRVRVALGSATVLACGVAIMEIGAARRAWDLPVRIPAAAFTARVGLERIEMARATFADLRLFSRAARSDRLAGVPGLFDRLDGRDVLILYIESYGRASFDVPFYAARHIETLRDAGAELERAGLAARSGWLTAPMVGGQSWLSHATLASGLWIPDQTRYRAYLASPRKSLYHLAQQAGYRTAAVMPAITYDWPEGPRMGFRQVLASRDLGYRGPPFNWVTMPDQFTLDAMERLLRADPSAPPLFAQVALVSSHAPWTPVPELLDWDSIGDGGIYVRWDGEGDAPEVVWADPDRVREQYRAAVDYALEVAFSYAAERAGGDPLLLIVGDHQTAPHISGSDSFDVPMHILGPPDVLRHLDGWGWTEGVVPPAEMPALPMDGFRDRFVGAFSSAAPDPVPDGQGL